ncbi:MAG: TonB-dependent receptor plug domain-containing protein, partial [Taibaiella sp.]|nr:TonB-dependent receptor plug domain-containing protein [Taibaiella sp.]
MKRYFVTTLLCLVAASVVGQGKVNFKVMDRKTGVPLEFVVVSNGKEWLAATDSAGGAAVTLTAGIQKIVFSLAGYERLDTSITLPLAVPVIISLSQKEATLDEVTVVSSGRNNEAIENSPMKIEVIGAADVSEEVGIKPGNIASILGDVSGVQIQQSSAVSGNSNVRIQGLDGRYTQILRDGMPLYDGFSGGFGILTVPPLDLQQIELIKGSASTLYGGGAIGGLINLISKRPAFDQKFDALVNYSTLNEGNANVYASRRNKKMGYTVFAGYTRQKAVDVNGDGLSDLPDANSFMVHPKLFFYPNDKTIISMGYSGVFDDRKGGDMRVLNMATDTANRYFERNKSQRHTGEYAIEHFLKNNARFTLKGNVSAFAKNNTGNTAPISGNQTSYYNEAFLLVPIRKIDVAVGVNIVGDNYSTTFPDSA